MGNLQSSQKMNGLLREQEQAMAEQRRQVTQRGHNLSDYMLPTEKSKSFLPPPHQVMGSNFQQPMPSPAPPSGQLLNKFAAPSRKDPEQLVSQK